MLSSLESFPSVASDTLDEVPCCRLPGIVGSATGVGGEEGNFRRVRPLSTALTIHFHRGYKWTEPSSIFYLKWQVCEKIKIRHGII